MMKPEICKKKKSFSKKKEGEEQIFLFQIKKDLILPKRIL